jgi:hypothetical protein
VRSEGIRGIIASRRTETTKDGGKVKTGKKGRGCVSVREREKGGRAPQCMREIRRLGAGEGDACSCRKLVPHLTQRLVVDNKVNSRWQLAM